MCETLITNYISFKDVAIPQLRKTLISTSKKGCDKDREGDDEIVVVGMKCSCCDDESI